MKIAITKLFIPIFLLSCVPNDTKEKKLMSENIKCSYENQELINIETKHLLKIPFFDNLKSHGDIKNYLTNYEIDSVECKDSISIPVLFPHNIEDLKNFKMLILAIEFKQNDHVLYHNKLKNKMTINLCKSIINKELNTLVILYSDSSIWEYPTKKWRIFPENGIKYYELLIQDNGWEHHDFIPVLCD